MIYSKIWQTKNLNYWKVREQIEGLRKKTDYQEKLYEQQYNDLKKLKDKVF